MLDVHPVSREWVEKIVHWYASGQAGRERPGSSLDEKAGEAGTQGHNQGPKPRLWQPLSCFQGDRQTGIATSAWLEGRCICMA